MIEGMTKGQVSDTLARSTIFLDLGHFPGKDRLPREAALSGAAVVTGIFGASAFYEDVPIKEKVNAMDPNDVAELLRWCLDNITMVHESQETFVKAILEEREVFDAEVKELFL